MALSRFLIVFIATFLIACATTSINQSPRIVQLVPPEEKEVVYDGKDPQSVDLFLEKRLAENPSDSNLWWTRYRQGRLWLNIDPKKSCERFLELSQSERFPLVELARLRAIETCTDSSQLPKASDLVSGTVSPWMREATLRAGLKLAIQTQDLLQEAQLSVEVSKLESLQSKKIILLTRALTLFTERGELAQRAETEKRLYQIAPRLKENPPAHELLNVAMDFRKSRQFDRAHQTYQLVLNSPQVSLHDKFRALEGIRMAFKLEKKTENYVKATREIANFTSIHFKNRRLRTQWVKRYHDSHLSLARTIWTEEGINEAEQIASALVTTLKNQYPLDEVFWLKSRMAEERRNYSEAIALLEKAEREKSSDKNLRMKILWYKAWNLRKTSRHKEAVGVLRNLNRLEGNTFSQMRSRFWLAKNLQKVEEPTAQSEALETFKKLALEDSQGYYGLMAIRELGEKIPPLTPPSDQGKFAAAEQGTSGEKTLASVSAEESGLRLFARDEDVNYIEWLIAAGEFEIAKRFLDHTAASLRNRGLHRHDVWRELTRYYQRAGQYQSLFADLAEFPPHIRSQVTGEQPRLLFPQPFITDVSESGKKFGVLPELVYAIMRQESSFNPLARSPADAFGLLQLIPESAAQASELTGIHLATPEDLYYPSINIPTGTAFLRKLLTYWNGQFVLTVASYNASEKAIRKWLKTRYHGDVLEFIEDIPYEETRSYVKLVMRNFIYYRLLNANGQPLEFPSWCLDPLQDIGS